MDNAEKKALLDEREILITLLDFHVLNRDKISMSNQEFEEYVNAILDQLNELKRILDENTEII
jgi:hypothetical protein